MGRLWDIAPQLFGRGGDRPHRLHEVGAYVRVHLIFGYTILFCTFSYVIKQLKRQLVSSDIVSTDCLTLLSYTNLVNSMSPCQQTEMLRLLPLSAAAGKGYRTGLPWWRTGAQKKLAPLIQIPIGNAAPILIHVSATCI